MLILRQLTGSSSSAERESVRASNSTVAKIEKVFKMCDEHSYSKRVDKFKMDNCVICLGDFMEGDKIKRVPLCLHIFHTGCLSKWFSIDSQREV